ncbi:Glycerol-3-phosphate dehydrogenase, mitochondrial [Varanus komodoensis]|nr:Glycerol-3-phosphate dehydrogenase, mitochondrial [Varanus komodoensis]
MLTPTSRCFLEHLLQQEEDSLYLFEGNLASVEASECKPSLMLSSLPTRESQLQALRENGEFDVLIIGGGATGSGCALDAVTRGLKTALVERDDFSSGTSSRSTKLIHGGVRYLQKAIMKLDLDQYRMVKEALHERANLLEIAPHLSSALPIMLPVYKWWQLPYYWVGIKMYDLVAGSQCLKSSYVLSKSKALELFPMLRKDRLVGAIVYYDAPAAEVGKLCSSEQADRYVTDGEVVRPCVKFYRLDGCLSLCDFYGAVIVYMTKSGTAACDRAMADLILLLKV